MTIKNYVTRRREHARTRADQYRSSHGPAPNHTHNYFGGHSLGYWEGRYSALDDVLGELDDQDAQGPAEAVRWLKALVAALDDGRIRQAKLSSGTDYIILCARDYVRRTKSQDE